jgi:hypothetical protein
MWALQGYSAPAAQSFSQANVPQNFNQVSLPQYQAQSAPTYQTYQFAQPQQLGQSFAPQAQLAQNLANQASQYAAPNIPAQQEQSKQFYLDQQKQNADKANADYAARGMGQSGALGGTLNDINNQTTQNIGSAYNQIATTAPQIALQNLLAASQGVLAPGLAQAQVQQQDIGNLLGFQQAQAGQNLGGYGANVQAQLGYGQMNTAAQQAQLALQLQQAQGLNANQLQAAQLNVGQQQAMNQLQLQQSLGLGQLGLQGTTAANQLNVQQSLGLQQLANQLAQAGIGANAQLGSAQIGANSAQAINSANLGQSAAQFSALQNSGQLAQILQILGGGGGG